MRHAGKSGEDTLMDITEEMSSRFGDAISDAYETTLRELQDYGLGGSMDDVFRQILSNCTDFGG